MTYSNDFLLFYVYAVALSGALLVSVATLTARAAAGSFRQWRTSRLNCAIGEPAQQGGHSDLYAR